MYFNLKATLGTPNKFDQSHGGENGSKQNTVVF